MLSRFWTWTMSFSVVLLLLVFVYISWQDVAAEHAKPVQKRVTPDSFQAAKDKFEKILATYDQHDVRIHDRTLVIFHVGDLGLLSNSVDVTMNNLKIFLNSIMMHSDSSPIKAFYLFNIADKHNPFPDMIPTNKANVAVMKWNVANSDLDVHLRTLKILGHDVTDRFGSVIFTNQGVRGPLVARKDGEWIRSFRNLFDANNVGLVGPTLSCEVSPHVQTHMFALQTKLIPTILTQMRQNITTQFSSWPELIAALEVGLTGVVMRAGYNVSAFYYNNRGYPYFQSGHCWKYTGPPNRFDKNPAGWCGSTPEDLVFLKWGGETMRTRGMICNTSIHLMENLVEKLALAEPEMKLTVPETLMGGPLFHVAKEYAMEDYMDRHPVPAAKSGLTDPKVCFLIRARKITPDQMAHQNPYSKYINKDLDLLLASLKRQTNPNWLAYLFHIDALPSDSELKDVVNKFDDPRVVHVPLPPHPYNPMDSGYSAVDAVLQQVLAREDCKYFSVASLDDAYGSEVVERVLVGTADMVLNPMDSRRYLEADHGTKREYSNLYVNNKNYSALHTQTVVPRQPGEYCGLVHNLQQSGFTHGFRPSPVPGKVDVASAFLRVAKYKADNLKFSDFTVAGVSTCSNNATDPVGYECLNRQATELITFVAQRRLWTVSRLPLDGLRSVVFHGNSPTLCIASGDVWVDSSWTKQGLDTSRARCITPKDALDLTPIACFDLEYFFAQDNIVGYCVRGRNNKMLGVLRIDKFWDP